MYDWHASERRPCVLAVGAHPDDAALSVGATLLQLADAGYEVVVLTLSSGELAGVPAIRETEEREAMRRLGASIVFARLPDGEIAVRDAIEAIDQVVRRYSPTIALVHSAQDTHQDHVVSCHAAAVSCRNVPTLLAYESPSSVGFHPTVTLDVTDYWERKRDALSAYVSQMSSGHLLSWVEATGRYRAWPRHAGAVCEGLQLCHARSLPALGPALALGSGIAELHRPLRGG